MDAATLFRVISLIPDRMARSQSGSPFDDVSCARAELLSRFLGWLGPLNPISKEEQQLLGVRAGSSKGPVEDELDPLETYDELEEEPVRLPEAGTQIAA
jgi:hypothetical protein